MAKSLSGIVAQFDYVSNFEPGNFRPLVYAACLLERAGRAPEAREFLDRAFEVAGQSGIECARRIWEQSRYKTDDLVLAPPVSGEDFLYDSGRFERLMGKADDAIENDRSDDARRYLLMAGDIDGFGRHPRRRRLLARLKDLEVGRSAERDR